MSRGSAIFSSSLIKLLLVSKMMIREAGVMCLRRYLVNTPSPGPNSTIVLSRSKSIFLQIFWTLMRDVGVSDATFLSLRNAFRN